MVAGNVLLTAGGRAKITDVGFANILTSDATCVWDASAGMNLAWAAPEVGPSHNCLMPCRDRLQVTANEVRAAEEGAVSCELTERGCYAGASGQAVLRQGRRVQVSDFAHLSSFPRPIDGGHFALRFGGQRLAYITGVVQFGSDPS